MNKPIEDMLEVWFDNTVGRPTLLVVRREGDEVRVINDAYDEEAEEIYKRLSTSRMARLVEELMKERGLKDGL